MRNKLSILFLFVWLGSLCQSVPNSNTFTLQNIISAVGGNSLQEAFNNANPSYFDATYNQDSYAPANSMLRFRNYHVVSAVYYPSVDFCGTTNLTTNSVSFCGSVDDSGGSAITARGVCISTSTNPTTANTHSSNGTGLGVFEANFTGLTANTGYYVRAYATNSLYTQYSGNSTFTTNAVIVAPTVITATPTGSGYYVMVGGEVTGNGGSAILTRGVCWSTSVNPLATGSGVSIMDGSGDQVTAFGTQIIFATTGTWHLRAYASNSAGMAYGSDISYDVICTRPEGLLDMDFYSRVGGVNITDETTARYYSSNFTCTGGCTGYPSQSAGVDGDDVFLTQYLTHCNKLSDGYYVMLNNVDVYLPVQVIGGKLQYIPECVLPTFDYIRNAINVTSSSFDSGGMLLSDGGCTITERGICASIGSNPSLSDFHASNGTGIGSYWVTITGLSPNTTYYYRVYAINSVGIKYGNTVLTFITNP